MAGLSVTIQRPGLWSRAAVHACQTGAGTAVRPLLRVFISEPRGAEAAGRGQSSTSTGAGGRS